MELMLQISTQKYERKKYLYASLDDEVSWHEWDFGSIYEFENNIIEYIANRVNRTIKTVTEVSRECFRMASYCSGPAEIANLGSAKITNLGSIEKAITFFFCILYTGKCQQPRKGAT